MRINPITLAFINNQELEYQKVFFKDSLPIVRVALLATSVLYGLFSITDFMVVGEHLSLFIFIRFIVVIPIIMGVFILSFYPLFIKVWQQLIFAAYVIGGIGICIMIVHLPANTTYYGGLMLIFSSGYFFIRLRFIIATIGGWLIFIAFNLLTVFMAEIDLAFLISYNFFYLSANFIGMFASYYIEISDRKNFFLNQQLNEKKFELENINSYLENMVEDRTKDLAESEKRFRDLSDMLPLMAYETDAQGNVTYANNESYKQLGLTQNDIIGKANIIDFVAPEYKDQAKKNFLLSLHKPGISKGEYIILRKDGTTIPILDYSNPIEKDSQIIGVRSVVVDLSDQRINEQLRTEIAVTRQSAEFKQNFLANMSHEIRTPLTGIIGITEILASTPLTHDQKEFVGTLKQSTENLREIINQILDYSKIEAGKMELKPSKFRADNMIFNAVQFFNSIVQNPVQLKVERDENLPACLIADLKRIEQIISNLISNAVKFTPLGLITLKVHVKEWIDSESLMVKVDVSDTGIGISEEQQKILFQPFSQVDHNDTRNFEGTGLGLTICKELAIMLNGEIGMHSTPENGSSFWFTFRAVKETDTGSCYENTTQPEIKASKTLRILLVEDKVVNQKVIGMILKAQGHEVIYANNGQQAIEKYSPDLFDMVLMDIQMPLMDGITATQFIRESYGNTPLIVGLSANAFDGDREKYISQGMDDYLTKPVKGENFTALVNKWFVNRPADYDQL